MTFAVVTEKLKLARTAAEGESTTVDAAPALCTDANTCVAGVHWMHVLQYAVHHLVDCAKKLQQAQQCGHYRQAGAAVALHTALTQMDAFSPQNRSSGCCRRTHVHAMQPMIQPAAQSTTWHL